MSSSDILLRERLHLVCAVRAALPRRAYRYIATKAPLPTPPAGEQGFAKSRNKYCTIDRGAARLLATLYLLVDAQLSLLATSLISRTLTDWCCLPNITIHSFHSLQPVPGPCPYLTTAPFLRALHAHPHARSLRYPLYCFRAPC
ncbi:hypothetical protein NUW54_g8448 [Trametes sanguinea]|uniref:Uncharacterized protein n=1 Tax=Trametes sanguinea TaxID=158606 RepID=A0ACC1PEY4_9APHY|nr:hypothetical protein NUW54_g8448 [Trametes sanguinea]